VEVSGFPGGSPLDPPLILNDDDMGVTWIPRMYGYTAAFYSTDYHYEDVPANADISSLDDKGLITLVKPNNEQTFMRVKNRMEELQRANVKGMASAAYLFHIN
jgi:hypothetical protein